GSMPWPETAPNRLVRALGRLLDAERPPRVLPEVEEFFRRMAQVAPEAEAGGYGDIGGALRDPTARARILAHRHSAAILRTTFAITMLRGSEKRNVIPPEAVAEIDCRMLAGEDPDEIVRWVREVVADEHVTVEVTAPPKQPNLSPPDTEMYKHLTRTLAERAPGVVVAPEIMTGFTDNWVFRERGLQGYGFGPFILDEGELARIHGNDERISLENVRAGVRAYTEMLLGMAGAAGAGDAFRVPRPA
ncbi:MAG: M20/M25/M40 family metallo-hydrolase, partial [Candidatus Rokubacteria bacterium]|nr:M20/M25/M40 family metallo-hydrolase [Candidatus Rokubacteria bacterium]